MQTFLILAILALGFIITVQIARASEFVSVIRGEEKSRKESNRINAFLLLLFLIVGLFGVYWAHHTLGDKILKFGTSASDHGVLVDNMMKYTLIATGLVFFATQILLFWYSYRYQESDTRKTYYFPHNNKLELIWTVVPAIVLTVLIGFGLVYWYKITGPAPADAMTVEITGSQFKWEFRYPGKDGKLGRKYFKEIDEAKANPLGQIWSDPDNHDDVVTSQEMHVVVNKPVKLVINAKDVIHDVGLPHFRMKMDAVPGMPTTMWFTPKYTTREMKEKYGQDFTYEISCDQMCGKGHYSMRGTIVVESEAEFKVWLAKQTPQYVTANGGSTTPAATPATKDSTLAGGNATKTSH